MDIAEERRLFAKAAVPMRTREAWGARHDYTRSRSVSEPVEAFFLHIAVVHDTSDVLGAEDQVMRNIEAIGRSRFGSDSLSAGISYNAAVFNTGRYVYEGQPLGRRGAHSVNDRGVGACITTGCPNRGVALPSGTNLNRNARAMVLPQNVNDSVTNEQIDLIARWAAAQIVAGYATPSARWHGHRCISAKSCPGDIGWRALPRIQALTDKYVKEGPGDMPLNDEDIAKIAKAVWKADIIPNDSGSETNLFIQAQAAMDRLLRRTRDGSKVLLDVEAQVRTGATTPAPAPSTPTGKGLTPAQIAKLAAEAGFTTDELPTAVAIVLAESNGNPKAVGGPNSNGSYDCGLFQINDIHSPTQVERFDPLSNARRARRIYLDAIRAGKPPFQPWSVFNSGSYLKRLDEAKAGVAEYLASKP